MGLITSVLTGAPIMAGTPGPANDFWYGDPGIRSAAGVTVSAKTALKLSAFYRGVELIADALASVPWVVQRNLPDDKGKERAKQHPWYRPLHRRPNGWQTSYEFRRMGERLRLVRGNFYARIDEARSRPALIPLEPDRVDVKLIATGRRGYLYKPPDNSTPIPYTQDEIFHVVGPSFDGIKGVSVIEYARESLGRAIAQQDFASRFFSQNATPATVATHPGRLSLPAQTNLEKKIEDRVGGLQGAHKILVLEEGMKVEKIGLSLRDSQFIELDTFSVLDVCRWLGVQPHKLMEMSRATFSNIEHQAIEFLTDTMDPRFVAWEQAAERDLLEEDDDTFSIEFIREGLLRGDLLSRFQAYAIGIQNGFMAENEARGRESLKKWPGLDEPRRSVNQDRGGDPTARPTRGVGGQPTRTPRPPDDEEDAEREERARAIAESNARRVVRKEIAAIRTQTERRQGEDLRRWVADFYGKHIDVLVEALCITETEARRYGAEHLAALLERGVAVLGDWEREAPAALAAVALGR